MPALCRSSPIVLALALSASALAPAGAQDTSRPAQPCAAEWLQRLRPVRPQAQALAVRTVLGSHCRRFPGDATRRVAAIVYGPPPARRYSEGATQPLSLTLVLAVLPATGAQVLQRYEKGIEEDAGLQVTGLNFTWDPAVYRLAPEVLALGLRFRNAAPEASCPDQRTGNDLSLLVPDGATLRPVFAAAMSAQVGLEGGLCRHTPAWEEHERTLALAPAPAGGWADLLLVNRITVQRRDALHPKVGPAVTNGAQGVKSEDMHRCPLPMLPRPACFAALALLLAAPVWAGCSRELSVPVSPIGLMVTVQQGQAGGAFVEVLQEAGRTVGCSFRFEPMPRARQEMLFLARRSDVMLPAQRTDRRDPFGQHVAMLQVRPTLVALRPLPAAASNSGSLLNQSTLRVAVLRGVDNGPAYRELLAQLRQRERLVVEADAVGVQRALRDGLADAALMNPVILQGQLLQSEQAELRELAHHLSARALPELDWQPTGYYLALEHLSGADRQLLAQALGTPNARARLWQLLRERYPGPLLEAGYRPLPPGAP